MLTLWLLLFTVYYLYDRVFRRNVVEIVCVHPVVIVTAVVRSLCL